MSSYIYVYSIFFLCTSDPHLEDTCKCIVLVKIILTNYSWGRTLNKAEPILFGVLKDPFHTHACPDLKPGDKKVTLKNQASFGILSPTASTIHVWFWRTGLYIDEIPGGKRSQTETNITWTISGGFTHFWTIPRILPFGVITSRESGARRRLDAFIWPQGVATGSRGLQVDRSGPRSALTRPAGRKRIRDWWTLRFYKDPFVIWTHLSTWLCRLVKWSLNAGKSIITPRKNSRRRWWSMHIPGGPCQFGGFNEGLLEWCIGPSLWMNNVGHWLGGFCSWSSKSTKRLTNIYIYNITKKLNKYNIL